MPYIAVGEKKKYIGIKLQLQKLGYFSLNSEKGYQRFLHTPVEPTQVAVSAYRMMRADEQEPFIILAQPVCT